ncbi:protein translocase subunit SecDF [Flavobacterium salilacus subsp. salilacus]|uniref:protein translocase subunit SecDF n=1 Tax=Flavobacterium TaxID=237 RepID=UPI00107575F2|nr:MULTISPECIES: protein translocase subunit SecDF [Flavobacterium]KAF2516917.1 protein translocase subunit SecDF [Flavobacterium salilacus subsp. salilacus]MBE1615723.1 protein translocase subunit SecDF [Flavobacterium sp. SaA2.13]
MQNKGLIKFFAILLAIVCIYQLSFTFVSNSIQEDAKEFANGDAKAELKYLDSIKDIEVYPVLGYTYSEVRDKQINKGLDLEGGINVTLEISVKDIIKDLANKSSNPVLNRALDRATEDRQGNQDYLDAFFIAFDNESKGSVKLASPELFTNRIMGDEVNIDMTDEQVKNVIRKKVNESIDSAFLVLTERIDKFGVVQPNIQRLGESGRILVELPGAKDIDRVKKLLQSTAQLEFWETYKVTDLQGFLLAANETLKTTEKKEEVAVKEENPTSAIDSLLTDSATDSLEALKGNNPLFEKLIPNQGGGGPVIGYASVKDTAKVNSWLKRSDIRSLLTGDQRYTRFAWSKDVIKTEANAAEDNKDEKGPDNLVELYALKGNRENLAPLSGNVITGASATFDQLGKPSVDMQMNTKGAQEWERMTGKAFAEKGFIAIVLDNIVYSAPGVTSGAISGGRSQISGSFNVSETEDLANILRAGKLPASADIIQSEVVGPSLGQEAIDNGINSALVGLLLISLWMIIYYGKAGVYANIALIVNLLFLFGFLASIGAVLTLPGIAGIVLTMGTAVDANIIIYERAKEELRFGRTIDEAIKIAFSWKGAMSAITDANVTTFLTGLVLLIFGTGPVKGFATTLLIGIITSLFTAIFITRLLLDMGKNGNLTFDTPVSKNWFRNFNFDFLRKKKIAYVVSSLLIIGSFVSLFTNGLDQGIDFVGGRTFQVRFDKEAPIEEVKSDLTAAFGSGVDAKVFGDPSQLRITTKYKVEEHGIAADQEVNKIMYDNLKKYYSNDITYDQFINTYDGKQVGIMQAAKVGPTIADDIKTNSYWAVAGSLLIVFLYLMISFRKWQYSLGAVVAVAHDVIIVLGIYSACYKFAPFQMEMNQHFIAAILTVIGYSLNDTVIVFDRIREFLASKMPGTFKEVVNKSINTTITRTINTSLTVIFVLLIMFIFGGESIQGFIFAMLVGIFVGTYSSLFIATPIVVDTTSDKDKALIEAQHSDAE